MKILLASFLLIASAFSTLNASPYHFSWQQELPVFGAGAFLSVVGLVADSKKEAPDSADLSTLRKNDVFALDRRYAGNWNNNARKQSDVILYSAILLPATLPLSYRNQAAELSLLYAESFFLTYSGIRFSKGLVNRYRPYAYDLSGPENYLYSVDTLRSFFSGHAAHVTASSVFFAKVFSDLNPQSHYIPYIWSAAGVVSLFGGWLRVEAGMHFPTDVMAGWLWGGMVGYWIPESHRQKTTLKIFPLLSNNATGILLFRSF